MTGHDWPRKGLALLACFQGVSSQELPGEVRKFLDTAWELPDLIRGLPDLGEPMSAACGPRFDQGAPGISRTVPGFYRKKAFESSAPAFKAGTAELDSAPSVQDILKAMHKRASSHCQTTQTLQYRQFGITRQEREDKTRERLMSAGAKIRRAREGSDETQGKVVELQMVRSMNFWEYQATVLRLDPRLCSVWPDPTNIWGLGHM